ncbi:hypothetical protein BTO05_03970 [Winogradskyella sp. PC-19]|nr:hypothetical protein BTO05_03970 [Winogradskyella sp. PC-19]
MGCKSTSDNNADTAFFGGEIINPKGDKVIFYSRDGKISDTLKLDGDNRFQKKFNSIETGVYYFRHGSEIQLVIVEPNDSIMIRLNTYDFDESLVFTGNGAKKNNYLLKTYNQNYNNNRKLVKHSDKEPEVFLDFVDKRHQRQLTDFKEFVAKKDISDFAKSIIKANIDYNSYADKEIYPFAYYGENKMVHIKDLPDNFYDYRANVDYNADHLSENFAYKRYLFFHFDNIAVNHFYSNNEFHSKFNRHELSYNKAKLDLVDSLVQNEIIKNNLLKYKTRAFVNNSDSQDEINEIMASYLSKTTNEEDIKYMNGLIASLDNLKPGKGLPDIKVINVNNDEYTIADVVDKPTLIYFWSTNTKKHYKNSHYRVKELKSQFPKMGFMSININDNPDKFWKETIYQYKFDLNNEYRFKNPKQALQTLAVNYLYKVIIVDNKANIIHPNVNIFSKDFENTLQNMILKKELVLK